MMKGFLSSSPEEGFAFLSVSSVVDRDETFADSLPLVPEGEAHGPLNTQLLSVKTPVIQSWAVTKGGGVGLGMGFQIPECVVPPVFSLHYPGGRSMRRLRGEEEQAQTCS